VRTRTLIWLIAVICSGQVPLVPVQPNRPVQEPPVGPVPQIPAEPRLQRVGPEPTLLPANTTVAPLAPIFPETPNSPQETKVAAPPALFSTDQGLAAIPVLLQNPTTPSLSLQRSGPSAVKGGQTFTYEITVRNMGQATAEQAKLEEKLPAGSRFIDATPPATQHGDTLSWTLVNLAPGAEERVVVQAQATRDGEWAAEATLISSVSAVHRAAVTETPTLPLVVTNPASVTVGQPVTFAIRVTNATASTIHGSVVHVKLSPGLQHLQGEATEGPVGDLAPGESRDFKLEVMTLKTGAMTADVTFLSNESMLAVYQASVMAVEQTRLLLQQTGPLRVPLHSGQDYKLEVCNKTSGDLHDVTIVNVLPEGLQFVRGDAVARFNAATRTIEWHLGTLAPGDARNAVFHAQMDQAGPHVNRLTVRCAEGIETGLTTIVRVSAGR
jgi:uncharacterized repeat protein (TIGR01451 family)